MRFATSAALAVLFAFPPAAAPAAPVSFRGLEADALGAAHHLVWSPRSNVAELRCDNLGSSGQDGIVLTLPPGSDAWSCTFGSRPPGTSAPEECVIALVENAGLPPFATWSFVDGGGFQRCVPDIPGATEYRVDVWNGDQLVFSLASPSPPTVDLPAGVSMTDDGNTVAVINNMRTRVHELEAKLNALGILTVNGVAYAGDRLRVGGRVTGGKHFASVKITMRYGGGGGGGAGGMTIAQHATRRFGTGDDSPSSPLGFTVDDGNVLASPPGSEPGVSVLLGPGMSDWTVAFTDPSRPAGALRSWSMTTGPFDPSKWALGGRVVCVAPSQWTTGPDTMRIATADDGSGTGLALTVSNAPGTKGIVTRAYSGSARLTLSEGPASVPVSVSIAAAPTRFHVMTGDGTVIARCALPPGTVVFSGGLAWPCDSLEFEVTGGSPPERCDAVKPGWLAGHLHDRCDVRFAHALHMHQFVRRGGVPVVAAGRAQVQPLGGGLVVHGIGSSGDDGADLGALGKTPRVVLKEYFEAGDKPSQLRLTATGFLSDGSTQDITEAGLRVGGDASGPFAGVTVNFFDQGSGPVFVQFSDGSVVRREECDDGDAEIAVRSLDGTLPAVQSVAFHQDSPWTSWVDVRFRTGNSDHYVVVRNENKPIVGMRVWRNRGGEHVGEPSPPVGVLQVRAKPPATAVASPPGTCTLEIEGIDVPSAGAGLVAGGPGATIGGHPVIPTWVRIVADTSRDGRDDDSDGDSADDGITLVARKLINPIAMDKDLRVFGEPEARGFAFTGDFTAAHARSDSVTVDLAISGTVLGAPTPRLYGLTQRRKYTYHEVWPVMENTPDPLLVRCFMGGAVVAEFPLTDSIETTHAPASVVVDDCDDDGRGDFQFELPPGARVVAAGGVEMDCDRIEVHAMGAQEPWALDGACRVTLNGLPPGVPVSGLRLATVPVTNPALGAEPVASARAFALSRPWPNPSRAALRASFALPAAARVRARVLDVAGRVVATLADARYAAGEHVLAWDGRAASGAPAPAGVYFLRVDRDGREALHARFTRLR